MKKLIEKLISVRKIKSSPSFSYPLLSSGFSNSDLKAGIEVLLSGQLTMSHLTKKFEKYFAKKIGTKYALMVNSGSSANLLSFFCITNPKRKNFLKKGDECLVPALCWSTSLWPVLQSGLKPVLVDVNKYNFCLDLKTIKKNVTKKTKAILIVNVLGNCSELDKIRKFTSDKQILLVEDNCESLGSIYKGKNLGTFGDFSSFSFYYSHQITSGEGGMVVCKNKNDYEILKSLRAHGWDRDLKKKSNKNDFNFINEGFNLRPLEVSAAIGHNQFLRLEKFKKKRSINRKILINALEGSKFWKNQFEFFHPNKYLKPSWFGLPLMISNKLKYKKQMFLKYLNKNKVETRPIISGNFSNQPSIKLFGIKYKKRELINTQDIEDRGFFIGLPTEVIQKKTVERLVRLLLDITNL